MRIHSRRLKKDGLTMVEILLVVSIVSALSLALYNTFSNGLRVWERSQRYVQEEDIAIFFDRVGRELRNGFKFSKIPFWGYETRIVFPTIIQTLEDKKIAGDSRNYVDQIGVVEYEFDVARGVLYRLQRNYSQALVRATVSKRSIVTNLKGVKFQYFFLDQDRNLVQAFSIDELPPVVRIEVTYIDQRGEERTLTKTVMIAGGIPDEVAS